MKLGEQAPDFSLKGVDGKTHTLKDSLSSAKALVVVFSCNHCPYVKAYESRLIELQRRYSDKGVRFVAINANDDRGYPEDSFENMVKRAHEIGYNFPYLRDDTQKTARAYGATHTPHLFAFDGSGKLAYTGKIDDNWQDAASAKQHFLRDALDDLVGGRPPRLAETHAIGCTIKWR